MGGSALARGGNCKFPRFARNKRERESKLKKSRAGRRVKIYSLPPRQGAGVVGVPQITVYPLAEAGWTYTLDGITVYPIYHFRNLSLPLSKYSLPG